jgi:NADH:ubiquinone reductase (H+-translocating)
VRTGTRLNAVEEDAAVLSTGERVGCRTVCWTAGVKPPPLVRNLGLPLTDAGRIDVDETLRVRGHDNVWAVGDSAAVPDPAKGGAGPTPPTAQHALRQGKRAAENVAAVLGHGHVRPFTYKTLGVFVDMGRHKAVAQMLFVKLRGFPAWWAARTYHLALMPGAARRMRLLTDWTVELLFQRDSAELGQLGHPPSLRGFLETPVPEAEAGEEATPKARRGSSGSG